MSKNSQPQDDVIERANNGDVKAQCSLGLRYHLGIGFEQDSNKAFEWLLKAANQGDSCAFYHIRNMKTLGFLLQPKGEQ